MPYNYSLLSIPAYYMLAMVPHVYSAVLVRTNKKQYDNASPRSTQFQEKLKTLPPKAYARYERARSAHSNMLSENMAFFVGAVLAGNLAGLETGFMNCITGWYLVSRVAYLGCYVYTEKQKYAMIRTAVFNVGCGLLFWMYFKAASAMPANLLNRGHVVVA